MHIRSSTQPKPQVSMAQAAYDPGHWFWQRSLQNRIVLTYGLLFLVILIALLFYTGEEIYRVQIEQAEHDLEVSAFLIANALEEPLSEAAHVLAYFGVLDLEESATADEDDADRYNVEKAHERSAEDQEQQREMQTEATQLQTVVNLYVRDETARITLLAVDGAVIADNKNAPQDQPNQVAQVEVQAALRGAEQHDIRRDPATGELTIYAAAPVQEGKKILGVVRLARPLQDVMRPTQIFLVKLAGGGLLALLSTSIIGILLGRYLVRPLRELEETAKRIAQGDLNQTAPEGSVDEVGTLAASFNHMVTRLRELLDRQRQFVANASHELRTPLTNIKLRSEAILSTELDLPERTRRYITEIDREADRLRRLANTLLNLANLERETYKPPTEPVNVVPLLWEVARSFRMATQQSDLTLAVQIPEHIPPLSVWPDHLVVVMNNLLDNAIKYTPAGGEIRLIVATTPAFCTLQIQNNGAGIPPEDLPHIFERFYRVDKARSRQAATNGSGSGVGLGLAIVKALVELNEGEIWVKSTQGAGTVFTVSFPIGEQAHRQHTAV